MLLGLTLGACKGGDAASPPKCDQVVDLHVRADANINPGAFGQALPVQVRVYQLKDRGRFDRADFHAMWQEDAATLEGDLLEKAELTLFPGSSEDRRYWRKAEAAYLGVVAIFRSPSGNDWRQVFPLLDVAEVRKRCAAEAQHTVRMEERVQAKGSTLLVAP